MRCPHSSFDSTKACLRLCHASSSVWEGLETLLQCLRKQKCAYLRNTHKRPHPEIAESIWEATLLWELICRMITRCIELHFLSCICRASIIQKQLMMTWLVVVGLGQPFQQLLSPSSSHLNLAVKTKHLVPNLFCLHPWNASTCSTVWKHQT